MLNQTKVSPPVNQVINSDDHMCRFCYNDAELDSDECEECRDNDVAYHNSEAATRHNILKPVTSNGCVYGVAWVDSKGVDHFSRHEEKDDANSAYNREVEAGAETADLYLILKSTD